MVQIEWSEEAEEDLDDILSYLSKSTSQYANSFFERVMIIHGSRLLKL